MDHGKISIGYNNIYTYTIRGNDINDVLQLGLSDDLCIILTGCTGKNIIMNRNLTLWFLSIINLTDNLVVAVGWNRSSSHINDGN